jgi:hypothetical protein
MAAAAYAGAISGTQGPAQGVTGQRGGRPSRARAARARLHPGRIPAGVRDRWRSGECRAQLPAGCPDQGGGCCACRRRWFRCSPRNKFPRPSDSTAHALTMLK